MYPQLAQALQCQPGNAAEAKSPVADTQGTVGNLIFVHVGQPLSPETGGQTFRSGQRQPGVCAGILRLGDVSWQSSAESPSKQAVFVWTRNFHEQAQSMETAMSSPVLREELGQGQGLCSQGTLLSWAGSVLGQEPVVQEASANNLRNTRNKLALRKCCLFSLGDI